MYARVLAGDPAWNGRFFTGVLTTGIYCLPSCKARKPHFENVRFFPTCEAARAAGLRPCKKCHPDDFARGADPVLEAVEAVVAEIRRAPAQLADVRAVIRRLGFGATRTFELFRLHYHTTPADLLVRARIDAAKALLLDGGERRKRLTGSMADDEARPGRDSIAAIAYAVGFEALSAFHDQFRRLTGLTPAAFRALDETREFELALPVGYDLRYLRRALGRDSQSVTERLEGDSYTCAVQLHGGPALLRLHLQPNRIRVEVDPAPQTVATFARTDGDVPGDRHAEIGGRVVATRPGPEAHALVVRLLGLDDDVAAFVRLTRRLGLGWLCAGRSGLRISRTPSVFDGLLWSIIGQQINFAFACVLKRRLIERTGTPLAHGLIAPPLPAAVAALSVEDLLPLQFSRSKAAYLIGAAQMIVHGVLDLDALAAMSATRAERTLLAVRGLGPWSVNYLMMRALGFADCVPLGDTGVTSSLQSLLQLEKRPDVDATRRLMAVFSPYRSLATAHLWQLGKPLPE